jgi:orotate phosphoribosyltransferase
MDQSADQRRQAMRDRLLTLLVERSYHYRPEQPFTLSSGATSPFYLDARVTTWDPEAKPLVGALVFELVTGKADAIGGLTLGADPIAGAVAYHSQLVGSPIRAFTVRKQVKEHGMARFIEGSIRPGDRVAVVDDTVTTGTSTLDAVDRCRQAGHEVTVIVVLVDREEGGLDRIRAAVPGVTCTALFTRADLDRRAGHARSDAPRR